TKAPSRSRLSPPAVPRRRSLRPDVPSGPAAYAAVGAAASGGPSACSAMPPSLGAALAGQQKFAAAEPLLKEAYAGLKRREAAIPPQNRARRLRRRWPADDAAGSILTTAFLPERAAQWLPPPTAICSSASSPS